ncbi:Fc.00g043590.m01.CDS01 [Cosmosporella sp. VM-42]
MGATNRSLTVAMDHLDTLIWSQSIIKVDGNPNSTSKWPNYTAHASECALYYCVKNYTSEVRSGTLFEKSSILQDQRRVLGSWWSDRGDFEGISDVVAENLAFHPIKSAILRSDLQLGRLDENFGWNVSQHAVDGISSFMQKTFAMCLNGTECTTFVDNWVPVNGFFVAGDNE